MNNAFWREAWRNNRTPWHQREGDSDLHRFVDKFPPPPALVFVPMCGKSYDLIWLAQRGYSVLGVDLAPEALQGLYAEMNHTPVQQQDGPFVRYHAGDITTLEGDMFAVGSEHLEHVNAVFDRAALIALPPEMRQRYVTHLRKTLPVGTVILLISLDYHGGHDEGPPFSVAHSEIERLYHGVASIEQIDHYECSDRVSPAMLEGSRRAFNTVWLIHL